MPQGDGLPEGRVFAGYTIVRVWAPAVFRREWPRAAIAAANGLDVAPG
jgi:hypothetical protein